MTTVENPFEQVAELKRAGFGTLRLPFDLGGSGLTAPQLFSAVIDLAPRGSHCGANLPDTLLVHRGTPAHRRRAGAQ